MQNTGLFFIKKLVKITNLLMCNDLVTSIFHSEKPVPAYLKKMYSTFRIISYFYKHGKNSLNVINPTFIKQ